MNGKGADGSSCRLFYPSIATFAVGVGEKPDRPVSELRLAHRTSRVRSTNGTTRSRRSGRTEGRKEGKSAACEIWGSHGGVAERLSSRDAVAVSCSRGPEFKFGPEDRLSWVTFFVGYQHPLENAGTEYQCTRPLTSTTFNPHLFINRQKGKYQVRTMKAHRRSGSTAPLTRLVAHPDRFTPGDRSRSIHCTEGWVGPKDGTDFSRRLSWPCRDSTPGLIGP
jgi:hypothetical protein